MIIPELQHGGLRGGLVAFARVVVSGGGGVGGHELFDLHHWGIIIWGSSSGEGMMVVVGKHQGRLEMVEGVGFKLWVVEWDVGVVEISSRLMLMLMLMLQQIILIIVVIVGVGHEY